MANTLSWLWKEQGASSDYVSIHSAVGWSGKCLVDIDKAGGKSTTFGRLKCTSRTTGITCKSLRSNHGFTVSTSKQRVF